MAPRDLLLALVPIVSMTAGLPAHAQAGWTWYVTGGSDFALSKNWNLAVEFFYSPLDVLRPGYIEDDTDGLFNARVLARWNVR
jgi:hypothetical protein